MSRPHQLTSDENRGFWGASPKGYGPGWLARNVSGFIPRTLMPADAGMLAVTTLLSWR
jgi:hypothetical protein